MSSIFQNHGAIRVVLRAGQLYRDGHRGRCHAQGQRSRRDAQRAQLSRQSMCACSTMTSRSASWKPTGDEINFIQSVRTEQFTHVDFTFFAADAECTRNNWKRARDAGSAIIDLSGALEEETGRASALALAGARTRGDVAAGVAAGSVRGCPSCCRDSGAAACCGRARRVPSVAPWLLIFEPASEQGQKGMDELHQQTVNLLSFQPLPKDVFDEQVAFNMLARYGPNSQLSVDLLEARVRRHYQKIAGANAPQPAMMVLQPPVFHGHALAIFLEMEHAVDRQRLSQALAGDHITLAGADDDSHPSNVNTAGQANILVSLKSEASRPNGIWLWAAGDNLRIAAITAVECAESMIATRPMGKIQ